MKYLTCLFVISVLTSSAFAQTKGKRGEFVFQGKIIGLDTGYIYLAYTDTSGKYRLDSCFLHHGGFQLKGYINEPSLARFYGKIRSRDIDDPNFVELFIEPTSMQGVFKVDDFKRGKVTGSKTQIEYSIYHASYDSLDNKWQQMFVELDKARAENDTVKTEKIYNEKMPVYRKQSDDLDYGFLRKFPDSYVSANILFYKTQILPVASLKTLYESLSKTVQNSYDGQRIKGFIQKAEKVAIGMPAPEFIELDLNEKTFSLKDFRGKYVLLDFWASWCIPCRAEHPYLKQAYSKFQDKGFTIISFSLDKLEDKDAWIDAIAKDDLPWIQACDFKGWSGKVVNEYNLFGKGIPANFLISPQGKIIARDLRGDRVEKTLAKLIN
ncbi:MAG: AhpC/TSA family protein [Williamsia sp.]|nr:AhpC/TSA family protein [Williamsia sp.]